MDPNAFMMGGGGMQGQMPPAQMQQAQMQQPQMQAPQTNMATQQIYGRIIEELHAHPMPPGWQSTLDIRERAAKIMELVTALRTLNDNINLCLSVATQFESAQINSSANKEQWLAGLHQKMMDINRTRASKFNMMPQNNPQMQPQQQNFMSQTPMQMSRSNQGEMPKPFTPDLNNAMQQQMRASPMNMPPQARTMNNQNINQNINQNMNQTNPQPQQKQPLPNGLTQEEYQMVLRIAAHQMSTAPKEQLSMMREKLISSLNPAQREQLQRTQTDPLQRQFVTNAMKRLLQQKMQAKGQGQPGQGQNTTSGQQLPNQQRPTPRPGQQSGGNQQGNQDIDFSAFVGQQADAMKMQGAGELVVPASNNNGNSNNSNNNSNNNSGMNTMQNPNSGPQMNMGGNQMPTQIPPGMTPVQFQQMMAQRQQSMRHNQVAMSSQAQAQAQAQIARNAMTPQPGMQQLRGQPGGLNVNQTPQQSPAMSMLNRPMGQPGRQGTPATQNAQQNAQQPNQQQPGVPHMAPQKSQQGMMGGPFGMQGQIQFPPDMSADIQQKISALPPDRARIAMSQWRMRAQNQRAAAQNGQQGQINAVNQPAMPPHNQPITQPQPQQSGFAGNQQGPTPENQQRLMQLHAAKLRAMDQKRFPPNMINGLTFPPNIQTWGQAKQYVGQNAQILPQGTQQKIMKAQQVMLHREEQARNMQQNQGPMAQAAQQPPASTGPAPQAVMGGMTGAAPQQPTPQFNTPQMALNQSNQQQALSNFSLMQVTPQEMQAVRQRMPQAVNMTDDQVRNLLYQMKMKNLQQRNPALFQQQQEAQMRAQAGQPNVAQPTPQPPQQRAMPGQPGVQPGQSTGLPAHPGLQQNQASPMPGMQQPQNNSQRPGQRPQPLPQFTPEQIARLTPQQRAQFEFHVQQRNAMMAANMQQNAPFGTQRSPPNVQSGPPSTNSQMNQMQMRQRAQALVQEADRIVTKGPPLRLDPATHNQSVVKLKELVSLVAKLEATLSFALASFGEDSLRKMLHIRASVYHQMHKNGELNGGISISLQEIIRMEQELKRYLMAVRSKFNEHQQKSQAAAALQQGGKPQSMNSQPSGVQQSPPQAPLAPEASRQNVQASNLARTASQMRKASTSKSSNAAANSDAVGAPSPQGVPLYDGKPQLTQANLHIPPRKKPKPGAGITGQGASSSPTTAANKAISPEVKRQSVSKPEPPKEPERRFKCGDVFCDFSIKGFEKEEELRKHVEEAHAKISDPFEFFIKGINDMESQDKEKDKAAAAASAQAARNKTAVPVPGSTKPLPLDRATLKKEALKHEGKKDVATPASGPAVASPASPTKSKKATPNITPKKDTPAAAAADVSSTNKTMEEALNRKYGLVDAENSKANVPTKEVKTSPSAAVEAEYDFLTDFGMALDDIDTSAPGLGFDSVLGVQQPWEFVFDSEMKTPEGVCELPELTPDGSDISHQADDTAMATASGAEKETDKAAAEQDDASLWSFLTFGATNEPPVEAGGLTKQFWGDLMDTTADADPGPKTAPAAATDSAGTKLPDTNDEETSSKRKRENEFTEITYDGLFGELNDGDLPADESWMDLIAEE